MATADVKLRTPEDLLNAPDEHLYELVNGEFVEKKVGWEASLIATVLTRLFAIYDPQYQQGHVIVEGTYQCFPDDPNKVRRPDVSFVRKEKLVGRELPKGHCPIVPDLIVEVVSPNYTYAEVEGRIEQHFRAGVTLAWVINPESRVVVVYRGNRSESSRLHEADELEGEDVLPGFRCLVRDIFAPLELS